MKQHAGSVARLATPIKAWVQRFALGSLVAAAFGLMMLGKADTVLMERARTAVADAVAPILDAVSRPVATINDAIVEVRTLGELRSENQDLRARNERLLEWQAAARRLEAENQFLRSILQVVPEPGQRVITARVIADQTGAFVRSVLINGGLRDGVARGQAAMTGVGLAGRVAQVGDRAARVLLITDMNSRIPVLVGGGRHRAVLAGDNTDDARLLYLGPRIKVEPGDRVVTSGHGGVLPVDLPVGVVREVGERSISVQPYVDWDHMEFLRLIDYELPGLLLSSGLASESERAQ